MGYNTRRVSLSLPDLGVAIPKRSRTQSHPSPPNTIVEGDESERPAKISKTSHARSPPPAGSMSPPRTTAIRTKQAQELSPPPSPPAHHNKVDVEGINDDVVVGTIRQLEQTGNRPILVKELATVLATNLHSVEKSANPSALISSRLTAYLNRSWPAISPCPLAKDLSPVHPRRLYFFLTTMPRQPIPETVEPLRKPNRIISPSLSSASAADEEDERYNRNRQALSPSPEVDLSSPELDDENIQEPPTPGAPFSGRNSVARERSESSASNLARNRRAASPQLENEERDFKQCASALYEQAQQQRRNSQQSQDVKMEISPDTEAGAEKSDPENVSTSIEESEESAAIKNSEAATALFGNADHLRPMESQQMELFSSPLMQAKNVLLDHSDSVDDRLGEPMEHMSLDIAAGSHAKDMAFNDWEDGLKSPEKVDLDELEDLFDAY